MKTIAMRWQPLKSAAEGAASVVFRRNLSRRTLSSMLDSNDKTVMNETNVVVETKCKIDENVSSLLSVVRDEKKEEEFRLFVFNLGKWNNKTTIKPFLESIGIESIGIKKQDKDNFGFIQFASKEARDAALPILQNSKFKGKKLDANVAEPKKNVRPIKRKTEGKESDRNMKDAKKSSDQDKSSSNENSHKELHESNDIDVVEVENVLDSVTPWWDIDYNRQLCMKEILMRKMAVKIGRAVRRDYMRKDKRIAKEKSRRKEDGLKSSQAIPSWVDAKPCFYIVSDGKLLRKGFHTNEKFFDNSEWKEIASADDITSIVSYNGSLLGVKSDGNVYRFKASNGTWNLYGTVPDDSIVALTPYKGIVYCCTLKGKFLQADCLGENISIQWKPLVGLDDTVKTLCTHNECLIAITNDGKWMKYNLEETKNTLETNNVLEQPDNTLEQPNTTTTTLEQPDTTTTTTTLKQCIGWEQCNEWEKTYNCSSLDSSGAVSLLSHNGDLLVASCEGNIIHMKDGSSIETFSHGKIVSFTNHTELFCAMDEILPSPCRVNYRNKCEFSVGFDSNGVPCVGFRKGLFKNGSISIESPENCTNVSIVMKAVCAAVQKCFENSPFGFYDRGNKTGVWRSVMVRESKRTKDLMVVLQANPATLDKEEWKKEVERLVKELTCSSLNFKITSLFLQEFEGVSAPSVDHPVLHLFGETYITENLLGIQFRVSPQAFFQVNTEAAEVLLKVIREYSQADQDTTVLDVCCGTGTIGLCLSESAGNVFGIELCQAATVDAAKNAERNGITNALFHCSKAESIMSDLLKGKSKVEFDMKKKNVVIVDPPRGGLHIDVIRAIRGCREIKRLVYVSCNPTGTLITDAARLCGPSTKSLVGSPFQPTRATPVDMFPDTPHCELVVLFERFNN